jgi:hypothetical protein
MKTINGNDCLSFFSKVTIRTKNLRRGLVQEYLVSVALKSGGQEIKFQEIETGGQKLCKIFMRSKVSFCKFVQEIEKALGVRLG